MHHEEQIKWGKILFNKFYEEMNYPKTSEGVFENLPKRVMDCWITAAIHLLEEYEFANKGYNKYKW